MVLRRRWLVTRLKRNLVLWRPCGLKNGCKWVKMAPFWALNFQVARCLKPDSTSESILFPTIFAIDCFDSTIFAQAQLHFFGDLSMLCGGRVALLKSKKNLV